MVLHNPLFPSSDDAKSGDDKKPDGYLMSGRRGRIEPLHDVRYGQDDPSAVSPAESANPAVKAIRAKLDHLYATAEPNALQEEREAQAAPLRSPHQQFMYELSTSGKSLAQIQTEWHNYYVSLPDEQKHQVWQEFYDSSPVVSSQERLGQVAGALDPPSADHSRGYYGASNAASRYGSPDPQPAPAPLPTEPIQQPQVIGEATTAAPASNEIVVADYSTDYQPAYEDLPPKPSRRQAKADKSTGRAKQAAKRAASSKTAQKGKAKLSRAKQKARQSQLQSKVRAKVKTRAAKVSPGSRQNLHSLAFGLATGLFVLLIFMFSFFNQVIITPFIRPGQASAAPIIVDQDSLAADGTPRVIIPKINVDIPVVYDINSSDEAVIQQNLEDGTIHYPTTEVPGQKGNVAIFGHSSNNIFNPGKYKFAFVLLHTLKPGDVFYLTYDHQVYGYKVIDRKIVDPSDVYVLNDVPGQTATATLITCDPPGTSLHRLVVVGQQVSPNPADNSHSTTKDQPTNTSQPARITGNGPSLWSRIWNGIF